MCYTIKDLKKCFKRFNSDFCKTHMVDLLCEEDKLHYEKTKKHNEIISNRMLACLHEENIANVMCWRNYLDLFKEL